jgi:DNA-binding transcriptional ArsR family regulator
MLGGGGSPRRIFRKVNSTIQFVERRPAPPLLPILRSEQQARILTLLLSNPDLELSLSELSRRAHTPQPSVHREIQRAEMAGLVTSRRIGNARLVKANTDSPYYQGLADVLTKAFGAPRILAQALHNVRGVERAYIFGSWAARFHGVTGTRPVGDIDLLVIGDPDRDALYEALHAAGELLGRPVQVTIRGRNWLSTGTGSFHEAVATRPLVEVDIQDALK